MIYRISLSFVHVYERIRSYNSGFYEWLASRWYPEGTVAPTRNHRARFSPYLFFSFFSPLLSGTGRESTPMLIAPSRCRATRRLRTSCFNLVVVRVTSRASGYRHISSSSHKTQARRTREIARKCSQAEYIERFFNVRGTASNVLCSRFLIYLEFRDINCSRIAISMYRILKMRSIRILIPQTMCFK